MIADSILLGDGMKTIRIAMVGMAVLVGIGLNSGAAQTGATIWVTSLEDKISSRDGCSLQEAIYSANFDENKAPDSFNADGSDHFIATQCVPGHGDDVIVLPAGAVLQMDHATLDGHNPFGPTATPMVTSNIRIEANGARFQHAGNKNFRAFAVSSTGRLTMSGAYIGGFTARGGDGALGGGGGLGAGGAIFLKGSGTLIVENSTFERNGAIGGNGSFYPVNIAGGGGGGGMGGSGSGFADGGDGGGGGGSGGDALGITSVGSFWAGGGTIPKPDNVSEDIYSNVFCGGTSVHLGDPGQDGLCPGGGGGGGHHPESTNDCLPVIGSGAGRGGNGNYGGGGGGGGSCEDGSGAAGGNGGFGGGGGAGASPQKEDCDHGGNGGFGGGGGACSEHEGGGGNFGGNAIGPNGGGGAGLGGALFTDGGTLVIRNSTFTANFALRGVGGSSENTSSADNGADAGGAIFAYHGSTTLQQVTIDGNETTGPFGGVEIFQLPGSPSQPTSFTLDNSIISNNGVGFSAPSECIIDGTSIDFTGTGNLIVDNNNCPGVFASADPHLGPLRDNGGPTPTKAITKTSPAFNAADPSVALSHDQTGTTRPQAGGFDIGAFEVCVSANPLITFCENPDQVVDPPPTVRLTMQASPAAGGILSPPAGDNPELLNSVVLVKATANPGYDFSSWTSNVTVPLNPLSTIVMSQPQTVVATFTPISTSTTNLLGNIDAKSGRTGARVWTLSVTDNGPAIAYGTTINSFMLTQTAGTACTPVVANSFPLLVGDLAVSQTGTANVNIDFSNCAAAARFTAIFTFSANAGFASGTVTRTNQFQ